MANHEIPEPNPGLTHGYSPQDESRASPAPPASSTWPILNTYVAIILVGVVLTLLGWLDLEVVWTWVKVAIGLGLVIFVHELGHFLVAKWCDVHVEAFSIGFGPAIPGCRFQRGETTYMIAMFPLGGYVKMVGEGAENEEGEDDPRSFKNKTVGQRMAIISAGVVMNVILACLCFIFVYMIPGEKQPPGVIGAVDDGSPAWIKGMVSGDTIHQVGSVKDPFFTDLMPVVMLTPEGQKLPIKFGPPGKNPVSTEIEPRRAKDDIRPVIGVMPPLEPTLPPANYPKDRPTPTLHDSAASRAEPPFQLNDKIVGTTDPANPSQVSPLPPDPRNTTAPDRRDYFEFRRRLHQLAGKEMVFRVKRGEDESSAATVDIKVPPAYHSVLGLRMRMGHVTAIQEGSPAARAGVQAKDPAQDVEGDVITEVEVDKPGGGKVRWVAARPNPKKVPAGVDIRDLDPVRLEFDLEQWATAKEGDKKVKLIVLRQERHDSRKPTTVELDWDDSRVYDHTMPNGPSSPMAISGLGLAYRVETTIAGVVPDSPADKAGLQKDGVVKAIRYFVIAGKAGQSKPIRKWIDLEPDQWAWAFHHLQNEEFKKVLLKVERPGQPVEEIELEAVPDESWPNQDRGLILISDLRVKKADDIGEAIAMGVAKTHNFIILIYRQLHAILTGQLSHKNIGGPIEIATRAYDIAGYDIYTFILFLGMISVNLAVINFLPIPVLDGGHMVFLIYEKLRGRPASEQVRVAATWMGLALIASLMLFVIYLDVTRRWF